jgi:hypothetical protein
MASNNDVLAKANDLEQALEDLLDNPAYSGYRELLTTRQADVASASNGFTADDPGDTILGKVQAALSRAQHAQPNDPAMSALARAVDDATAAMNGG